MAKEGFREQSVRGLCGARRLWLVYEFIVGNEINLYQLKEQLVIYIRYSYQISPYFVEYIYLHLI